MLQGATHPDPNATQADGQHAYSTDDLRTELPEGGGGPKRDDGTLYHQPDAPPTAQFQNRPSNVAATNPRAKIINIPNGWAPRFYQRPSLEALDAGKKRIISCWHRRAGKDSAALNHTAKAAMSRVGVYWHMLPTAKQAREVVWTNVDKQGRRMIDQAFPKELRKRTIDDEMMIEFKNGSFWKLRGADNFDSNVGANPAGIVFSEFSITDPRSWDYMEPILLENGGWAWFIFTPRGKNNHAFDLFEYAKTDPEWHWDLWPVDKTKVMALEQIEKLRQRGVPEERIQQEYYCSFEQSNLGAVYGKEIEALTKLNRFGSVPYDASYPVETAWDFGKDGTAVWFVQRTRTEVRVIDFIHGRNQLLPHYLSQVIAKPYRFSRHIAPHDGFRENFVDGNSIAATAAKFGIRFWQAPKLGIDEGIEAGRVLLSRCTFDTEKCAYGIKALKHYHRTWDEEKLILSPKPVHDWSSHPADAFRYLAVAPEAWGIVPDWASAMMNQNPAAFQQTSGNYDPLAGYR